jgi:hypothetical protein
LPAIFFDQLIALFRFWKGFQAILYPAAIFILELAPTFDIFLQPVALILG